MKKFDIKSLILGFIIGTIGITTIFAAGGIKSAEFNSSKVYFYGKEVPLKSQLVSIVKDGESNVQIYMPMKELLEYMNFVVEWNKEDNSINLTMKGNNGNINYDPSKLSPSEADKKCLTLMEGSGTWGPEINMLIPYMTPDGVEKVVTIYLDRHLFAGITTPESAKQVASTIDTALKYMTEDAKKAAKNRISAYY